MEHFSLGAGLVFSETHSISLLYGSNFFVKPKEFSTYFLQYYLKIEQFKFRNFTPIAGLKGGHSTFTDQYYIWKIAEVIPFIGLQYPVNKIDLQLQGGCAFSFEQSVERIRFGDIGHYRSVLPEIKLCAVYNFGK